jgi:hypothetical protein
MVDVIVVPNVEPVSPFDVILKKTHFIVPVAPVGFRALLRPRQAHHYLMSQLRQVRVDRCRRSFWRRMDQKRAPLLHLLQVPMNLKF